MAELTGAGSSDTPEPAPEGRLSEGVLSAPSAWSPDGTRIAFAGIGPSGNSQLFVADAAKRTAIVIDVARRRVSA